jgi:hypothetical protein
LITIIRQFHLQERRAFQRIVKQTPRRTAQATPTERRRIAGSCIRRTQSAAELNGLDTRAYMPERLWLDFVPQQQQQQRSKRDSISIHIAGRMVKHDHDLMTILTYVSMGYDIGVVPQTMTRMNIPNVAFRGDSDKLSAEIGHRLRLSPQRFLAAKTDLLIRHMRSHALLR